jgi:hypothetical protein
VPERAPHGHDHARHARVGAEPLQQLAAHEAGRACEQNAAGAGDVARPTAPVMQVQVRAGYRAAPFWAPRAAVDVVACSASE